MFDIQWTLWGDSVLPGVKKLKAEASRSRQHRRRLDEGYPDRRDRHAGQGVRCVLRDARTRRRHHDGPRLRGRRPVGADGAALHSAEELSFRARRSRWSSRRRCTARTWGSARPSSPNASTSRRRRRSPAPSARCRTEIGIATAATNHNTRHPMVTARVRDDHAQAHRRALLARPGPRYRAAVRRLRPAAPQDGRHRGLRRASCGASGAARQSSATTGGRYPVLTMGAGVRRAHPDDLHRLRPPSLELGGRVFDAVVLHTFFTDETTGAVASSTVKRARRASRTRPRQGARLVVLRHRRRSSAAARAAQEDRRPHGDLSPGIRRPAGEAPTAGTRRCCSASATTTS